MPTDATKLAVELAEIKLNGQHTLDQLTKLVEGMGGVETRLRRVEDIQLQVDPISSKAELDRASMWISNEEARRRTLIGFLEKTGGWVIAMLTAGAALITVLFRR